MPAPDLHIISFAVPYPANYGGAIDVWNRICALKRAGLKIFLHCFIYGSFKPHTAIQEMVEEVHYYPRISWPALLAPGQPYIVISRKNPLLISRLLEDKAPVLFEGIHTTGYLHDLSSRKKLLRSHNIEHQYYQELAKESQRFEFLFYQRESLALQRYEATNAQNFDRVFTISPTDQEWYASKGATSTMLPVFHGCTKLACKTGKGKYLLYQGDLSVESNQRAVVDIVKNLGSDFSLPFIVAGKKGSATFEEKLTKYSNLKREADVSEGRMLELIEDAHIHIIHSRHRSGMKVKLFPALYSGRFIVANENSLTKTPLDQAFHSYTNFQELAPVLNELSQKEFTSADINNRNAILQNWPSDDDKAKEIIRSL